MLSIPNSKVLHLGGKKMARTNKALEKTVERMALHSNPVELVNNMYGCHPLTESVRRIAEHSNPVELVNNMYGCHPNGNGRDYFSAIYGSL